MLHVADVLETCNMVSVQLFQLVRVDLVTLQLPDIVLEQIIG